MDKKYRTPEFKQALSMIENATDYEIGDIMRSVIKRYKNLFPGWQVIILSVPADNEKEQLESIEWMLDFLKLHKTL